MSEFVERDQIQQAALAVFTGKGYSGATMAEIAAQAGVNPATIYRYFKGKQELFCSLNRPDLDFPDQQETQVREKILQAALKVFSQKGFSAATMDDVAEAVGLSKAGVYFYYPSKENLFTSVIENSTGFERINAVLRMPLIQENGKLEDGLVTLAGTYLSLFQIEEFTALLKIVLSEGVHNASIAGIFRENVVKAGSENVAGYLSRYCQLPKDVLTRKVQALFGMLFSWGLTNCILANPDDRVGESVIQQTAREFVQQFLYGIHDSLKSDVKIEDQK